MAWDPAASAIDQLGGKAFGVKDFGTGEYLTPGAYDFTAAIRNGGASTPASGILDNYNLFPGDDKGLIHTSEEASDYTDKLSVTGLDQARYSAEFEKILGITKFQIELSDGTVLTQDAFADFEKNELIVRVQNTFDDDGTSHGYQNGIDLPDSWLPMLKEMAPVAKITISEDTAINSHPYFEMVYYDGNPENDPVPPICFTSGTLIATLDGDRRVETLRPGDLVLTRDHGPQELRWLGMRVMKSVVFLARPKTRPIRIRADTLGRNIPARDLIVSPQHRMLLQSKIVQRVFDAPQVLTAAKNLLELPGVEVAEDMTQVTYIHLMFDRHELVLADGAWSESLYLGKQAKLSLTSGQIEEIDAIFPGLLNEDAAQEPARTFAKGAPTRKLIQRSLRNNQPLFAG